MKLHYNRKPKCHFFRSIAHNTPLPLLEDDITLLHLTKGERLCNKRLYSLVAQLSEMKFFQIVRTTIDSSDYIRRNFWRGFQHDLEYAGRNRSHLYAVAVDYLMAVQFFSNAEWALEKTRKHVRTHYKVYCWLVILSAIWYLIGNFMCPFLLRENHYHAHDSFEQNQIQVVMRGTNVMEVQVSDKEGNNLLRLTPENRWGLNQAVQTYDSQTDSHLTIYYNGNGLPETVIIHQKDGSVTRLIYYSNGIIRELQEKKATDETDYSRLLYYNPDGSIRENDSCFEDKEVAHHEEKSM